MANLNRIRMASANSTAQLRGVAGEPTEGLTVNGSHNTSLDMHEFEVSISGNYTLYEDVDGGSTYVRRTDWSETTGKYVRGSDLEEDAREIHAVKYRKGYGSLLAQFQDAGESFVAGEFHGESGKTDTIDVTREDDPGSSDVYIDLQSGTTVRLPQGHKIDRIKTEGGAYGKAVFTVREQHDVVIDGGEIDGNAENNGFFTEHDHAIQITDSQRVIVKNMYLHNHSGDCVYVQDSEDILFENCIFDNPTEHETAPLIGRNCVAIVSKGVATQRIYFVNCTFNYGNPAAIDIEPDESGYVYDIGILNCSFNGDYRGVAISPATGNTVERVTIANCTFNGKGYGIEIGSAGSGTVKQVLVSNCVIKGPNEASTYGIWIKKSENVSIENCDISECEFGIYSYPNNSYLEIKNNLIYKNRKHGIYLQSGDLHVAMIGNKCFNNNQAGGSHNGIMVNDADYVTLFNNVCIDTQGSPTQDRGFQANYSTFVWADGNVFYGNVTGNNLYMYSCSDTHFGINHENEYGGFAADVIRCRSSYPVTFVASNGSGDSILKLSNARSGAADCNLLTNKGILGIYNDGVGYAKLRCDTIRFANARITAAATPGNFAANVVLVIENASGTAYYVPAMTATW